MAEKQQSKEGFLPKWCEYTQVSQPDLLLCPRYPFSCNQAPSVSSKAASDRTMEWAQTLKISSVLLLGW